MLLAALNLGSARAQFTLTASNAGNTATVAVAGPAITSLDLTGDFTTNFLLVNSDGTQTYASNATISVSGPDGLSFSSPIIDSGTVPVGSGYTVSSHETAFSFDIACPGNPVPVERPIGDGDLQRLVHYRTQFERGLF